MDFHNRQHCASSLAKARSPCLVPPSPPVQCATRHAWYRSVASAGTFGSWALWPWRTCSTMCWTTTSHPTSNLLTVTCTTGSRAVRSFCATASSAFGTMTQYPSLPLPTMCTLVVLFFGLLMTLPDSPHGQTPPAATATHLPRQRRAYLSRPTLPSADTEQLYGWDCFSHPHQTKVYSFRSRRRVCGDRDKDWQKLKTQVQTFSILQYRKTISRRLLTCSLRISRFEGRCVSEYYYETF